MKKIFFWLAASLMLILYIITSFADPGAKIAIDFRQACHDVATARKLEETSYAAAFKYYNSAINKLNHITGKYSSSDLALKLIKNQLKIGPYSYLEFKEEIIPRAKLRAEAENNPLDCAFYAISLLNTTPYQDKLKLMKATKLTEIAIRFSKNWRFTKASSVLSEAKAVVQTIYSDLFKVNTLTEMARILGKEGKKREALRLLTQAEAIAETMDGGERPEALLKLIACYSMLDRFESATGLINRLNPAEHDAAWSIICKNCAWQGHLQTALNLASKINDGAQKSDTFQAIVNGYATKGHFEKAQQLVARINPAFVAPKVKALADIAFHAGKSGERELAAAQFEQAIKTTGLFESYELPQKLSVLNYIAFRLLELRDFQNARRLLQRNAETAQNMAEFTRAEAFSEIAVAYGRMGEYEQALQLIQTYISTHLTTGIRNRTLSRLASEYAANHQYEKAIILAEQAGEGTTTLEADQTTIFSEIAIKCAAASDYQSALQLTEKIKCPFYRPWTLAEIALHLPNRPFGAAPQIRQYLHQIITDLGRFKPLEALPHDFPE